MSQNNVNITLTDFNLNLPLPGEDGISAMVTSGVAVVGGLQLNQVYTITSIDDLETILLVDQAYDTTNVCTLWFQVTEFFRGLTSDGKLSTAYRTKGTLFLLVVAQTQTLTNMCDLTVANSLKKVLDSADAAGKIRLVAICRNPATGYSPTPSGGLDGDVFTAITKAQDTAEYAMLKRMPIDIFMEGRSYNGAASAATDLATTGKKDVSIVLMADRAVSNANALLNGFANVGYALGVEARLRVNETIFHVRKTRIDDPASGRMVATSVANVLIGDPSSPDWDTLHDKHYLFPRRFPNYPGVYLNDSFTCAPAGSDYGQREHNRVIKKVARHIWSVFTPEIGANVDIDEDTGKMPPVIVSSYEAIGEDSCRIMKTDREIVGIKMTLDPDQDVISTSTINATIDVTPYGISRKFNFSLGLSNPFNS